MTRRFLAALGLALPILSASAPTARPAGGGRPSRQYTIEQFLATTTVGGPSFSPDGSKVLFTSDASGLPNAYTVPSDGGPIAPRDPLDDRLDLCGLLLPQGRPHPLHPRQGRGREQPPLRPHARGRARPDARVEAQGEFRRLVARRVGLLRPDQRARPPLLRRLPLRRRRLRADARLRGQGGLPGRRRLGRRPLDRARQAEVDRRRRHLPLGRPRPGKMTHLTPHNTPAQYRTAEFDPDSKCALLPDQRRGRVHPRPPLRPGRREARGRRVGRLGHPVDPVLPERQVTA